MSYPKFKEWSKEDKSKLLDNFKLLEKEFNTLGYQIILHGGTLLGSIRSNDLIKEDNDIDFIILHTSTDKEQVKKEIIDIDNYFHNQKRLCGDLHYLGNNHYFVDKQWFDGWHGWFDKDNKFFACFDIKGELFKEDILPLKINKLGLHSFNVPNNFAKLLTLMYGKHWHKPQSIKHRISGKWIYQYFLDGIRYLYPQQQLTQKELLLDLRSLLVVNGINFFLACGTVLGAIREHNFLPHDPTDIDIGLDIKDYWKVKEILDNSDFKYKYIWNKEIAIYKGDNTKPHIDLFFHMFDDNNAYCYSYRPNRITKFWNEEWRMIISKNIIEPLQSIEFLGVPFNIPNNPEKYLERLYGVTWKIPDTTRHYTGFNKNPYPVDLNYSSITAIVTTFNRPEALKKLVDSFCKVYPDIPLAIGNQNKEEISFNYPNVKILQLPYDCGLAYARNELVKHVNTEFSLLLEDDFVFHPKTDLYKMLEPFASDTNIGIVGGRLYQNNEIKSYEKYLFILDKVLLSIDWKKLQEKKIVNEHKINTTVFGIADIIYNFFLAKTEILRQYAWDNDHKIHSEHLSFFLNLKKNSKVKIAFIPEVLISHEHPIETPEYNKYRQRMYYNLIYEKHGIEKGYTVGESALLNYRENKKEQI